MAHALELDAPAKVNLLLRIRGQRPDGYHEVETILHELALHDTLVASLLEDDDVASGRPTDPIELTVVTDGPVSGLPVAVGEDNLVCRAARGFQDAVPGSKSVQFHLTKRIPAGGGLGGGSSDAAAALRLMNALHGDPLDDDTLHRVAASIGADVPFFLRGGTQFGRGIGDELTPIVPAPHFHFVLVLPGLGTSTAAIYKNHVAHLTVGPPEASIGGDKVPSAKEITVSTGFPNQLEAAALRLHPDLLAVRERVVGLGYGGVRMSGSGSTFFLAFEEEEASVAAFADLAPVRREGVGLLRTESNHPQHGTPQRSVLPGQI